MAFCEPQESEEFLERRREISIPKRYVGRMGEERMEQACTHRFGLPAILRESENGECGSIPVTQAPKHGERTVGTAVVHEEKTNMGKARSEGNERGSIQPPLFIEAWHDHRNGLRHAIHRRRCCDMHHSGSIILDMVTDINGKSPPQENAVDLHFSLASLHALDATEDRHFWSVVKRKLIISLIRRYAPREQGRIIDIGCGNGGLLQKLTNAFPAASLTGIDGYPQALLHCRRRAPHATLIQEDILHLERLSTSEPFDAAILADVLEHCDEPERVLEGVRKILAKNGIVIATVPASMRLWSDRDVFLGHRKRYTRREFEKLFHETGFHVLHSNYAFSYLYPPAAFFRTIWATFRKKDGKMIEEAELREIPIINTLLQWLGSAENIVSSFLPLPCGTSAYCVARVGQSSRKNVYSHP